MKCLENSRTQRRRNVNAVMPIVQLVITGLEGKQRQTHRQPRIIEGQRKQSYQNPANVRTLESAKRHEILMLTPELAKLDSFYSIRTRPRNCEARQQRLPRSRTVDGAWMLVARRMLHCALIPIAQPRIAGLRGNVLARKRKQLRVPAAIAELRDCHAMPCAHAVAGPGRRAAERQQLSLRHGCGTGSRWAGSAPRPLRLQGRRLRSSRAAKRCSSSFCADACFSAT